MDLSRCFDTLNHDRILKSFRRKVADGSILELLRMFLQCGVMIGERWQASEEGSPQGGVISPLISLLHKIPYQEKLREYFHYYPHAGYGSRFRRWARSPQPAPYGSYGNGSAMRVSPIAWYYDSLDVVLEKAQYSAEMTHNHPEGVRGAQDVAGAVFIARNGVDKMQLRSFIEDSFAYDLSESIDEIRPDYGFDVSCQGSVPYAILAFLESTDFEHAIRNAVSLGGDSDTQACIAGSIAEAYYGGVPVEIADEALVRLDSRLAGVYWAFQNRL